MSRAVGSAGGSETMERIEPGFLAHAIVLVAPCLLIVIAVIVQLMG